MAASYQSNGGMAFSSRDRFLDFGFDFWDCSCVRLILLPLLLPIPFPFPFHSDGHGFVRGCDDSFCGRERGVLLVSEL